MFFALNEFGSGDGDSMKFTKELNAEQREMIRAVWFETCHTECIVDVYCPLDMFKWSTEGYVRGYRLQYVSRIRTRERSDERHSRGESQKGCSY
jgi:hypothetical protein